MLPEAARHALENTLAGGSYTLDSGSTATFMAGLPQPTQESCSELLEHWGGEEFSHTAHWTVRVLLALRTPAANQALLALRCRSSKSSAQEHYDERLALASFAGDSSTLRFIPVGEDCDGCRDLFHHVEFSQLLPVRGGLLMELKVSDTHNPCCDGGDEKSKERLIFLAVPDGQLVLSLDQLVEDFSYDDSDEDGGDSNWVCKAKIDYARDIAAAVESIRSRTQCTYNDEPQPEVKERTFVWNASAHRFDEHGPTLSKSLGH